MITSFLQFFFSKLLLLPFQNFCAVPSFHCHERPRMSRLAYRKFQCVVPTFCKNTTCCTGALLQQFKCNLWTLLYTAAPPKCHLDIYDFGLFYIVPLDSAAHWTVYLCKLFSKHIRVFVDTIVSRHWIMSKRHLSVLDSSCFLLNFEKSSFSETCIIVYVHEIWCNSMQSYFKSAYSERSQNLYLCIYCIPINTINK